MRYLLTISDAEPARPLLAGLIAGGQLVCHGALAPSSATTTVVGRDGTPAIVPGPWRDGPTPRAFLVIDCDDLDGAIDIAERCGGTVEIRPVIPLAGPVDSAAGRSSA